MTVPRCDDSPRWNRPRRCVLAVAALSMKRSHALLQAITSTPSAITSTPARNTLAAPPQLKKPSGGGHLPPGWAFRSSPTFGPSADLRSPAPTTQAMRPSSFAANTSGTRAARAVAQRTRVAEHTLRRPRSPKTRDAILFPAPRARHVVPQGTLRVTKHLQAPKFVARVWCLLYCGMHSAFALISAARIPNKVATKPTHHQICWFWYLKSNPKRGQDDPRAPLPAPLPP